MAQPVASASTAEDKKKIIVALDVDSADEAREISTELRGQIGGVKIGLQLYSAAGPAFVREIVEAGIKVFLDLKFYDIPNTVAKAGIETARLGVWMFNVHASGGSEMMRRVVEEVTETCENEKIEKPLILGVTVLTSSDVTTLSEAGVSGEVEEQVIRLARLAAASGMDGVVASPRETAFVRDAVENPGFLVVTPGIRPKLATGDDQKRVTTFRTACDNGSDYVVIGRPIIEAADRIAAIEQIIAEL